MHGSQTNSFCNAEEQNMNKRMCSKHIRALNDEFRRTGFGGRQFITPGIQEMGWLAVVTIRQLVAIYDAFCEDNDPYGEHDFGNLTYGGQKVFWKIDYYDPTLTAGSQDPADPIMTTRVLTIMLAQEY